MTKIVEATITSQQINRSPEQRLLPTPEIQMRFAMFFGSLPKIK
jgi:hypothetical protein